MMRKEGLSFWMLQAPGWLLLVYLLIAQGLSAISYDLGVSMGSQEPIENVTEVGVAFWYGFALGDLLAYIPILLIGLMGHMLARPWGRIVLAAALGITVYWPVVCLITIFKARNASGWNLANETPYWVVLPLITIWALWGLWAVMSCAKERH